MKNNSRREFLESSLSFLVAQSFLGSTKSWAKTLENEMPNLPESSTSEKIIILGAGIAGLCAAYELKKRGIRSTVYEAQNRIGGRALTLRHGDCVEEIDSTQSVRYEKSPHHYTNMGPARIPHTHERVLNYCKELKIELEVFLNENRNAYFYKPEINKNSPLRLKQIQADQRGYLAETLFKLIKDKSEDATENEVRVGDLKKMLEDFGDLNAEGLYKGSGRAGFDSFGWTDHQSTSPKKPLSFSEIIKFVKSNQTLSYFQYNSMGTPLFQPVGGFDQIPNGFYKRVKEQVQLNHILIGIVKNGEKIKLTFKVNSGTHQESIEHVYADKVLCTLPLSTFQNIAFSGFNQTLKEDIEVLKLDYFPAAKMGMGFSERFWEKRNKIYGGISFSEEPISVVMYPSQGLFKSSGTLVSAYFNEIDEEGNHFSDLNIPEREKLVLSQLQHLHPDSQKYLQSSVSVAWKNMPFAKGAWLKWSDSNYNERLNRFLDLSGNLQFSGEHICRNTGWAEGAIASTHHALNKWFA